jgi:RIO-like serine/threonine protein kinase
VADELIDTLNQLCEHRISHGDMKGSNFLIERDKVWVLDLDALIQHKRNRAFAASWLRDKKRFLKNWDGKSCYAPWKRYFREKFRLPIGNS